MKAWIRHVLVGGVVAVVALPLVAIGLIVSQPASAVPVPEPGQGIDFSGLALAQGVPALQSYAAANGRLLGVRRYPPASSVAGPVPLLVLVHGSGWHGLQYHELASQLAAAGLAQVLVPDLRGHGPAPERRGDVDYIGQLEDDLAALIQAERQPGQPVVMLGHSSGGGLVIRFAGGQHGHLLQGAVLLAPFLQHDAPTTRPQSGGWAQPLIRRIIGQTLLNQVGVHAFDGLTAVQFRFPAEVLNGPLGSTATPAYSYRMMVSYAPRRDYLADAARLPPFLLLAGANDEAFEASAYAPTLQPVAPAGQYQVLPGVGHLGVVDDPRTLAAIQAWWGQQPWSTLASP